MRRRTGVVYAGLLLAFASASAIEAQTGTPPFGSFSGGPFDTVNNANLNVHFAIPIFSRTAGERHSRTRWRTTIRSGRK